MTATLNTQVGKGLLVVDFVGEATIGLVGNIADPEGCTLYITNSYCWIITPSVLAATMNVGIAATGVNNAGLHGALPMDGAAGTAWMGWHPAVTQDQAIDATVVAWTAALFLTFTNAAQSAVGCTAKFYFEYIRVD